MVKVREHTIQEVFWITLWLKALHAVLEIVGGLLLLVVSEASLVAFIESSTKEELTEDPGSLVAHYAAQLSHSLSASGQSFAAWYLLIHGVVKAVVIAGIFKKKLWVYPIALVVFSLFAVYQIARYTHTHSFLLIVFTFLDLVIIILTLHEYLRMKHLLKKGEFL